jgi:hypothetical protein
VELRTSGLRGSCGLAWKQLLTAKSRLAGRAQVQVGEILAIAHLDRALTAASQDPGCERVWDVHAALACCHARLGNGELARRHAASFGTSLAVLRERVPAGSRHRFDERPDVAAARAAVQQAVSAAEASPAVTAAAVARLLELS